MIPFFSISFFTGPAAHALGGADISPFVGFPIAGTLSGCSTGTST